MPVETPIQIDLSEENAWDSLEDSDISEEQKELLKEQFQEEKEWIIYLTKWEIQDLKATLEVTEDPQWEIWGSQVLWESFDDLVENQKQEWLALSDMLEGTEWLPEDIDNIDTLSHELLFGNSGRLTNLELSDTAQDHASAWFSLTLIDFLAQEDSDISSLFDGERMKCQIWGRNMKTSMRQYAKSCSSSGNFRKTGIILNVISKRKYASSFW